MTPLKRKVLEDEHPELVGLVVKVRVSDMAVNSHQIETGVLSQN